MKKVKKFRVHEERPDTRREKEGKARDLERKQARRLKETFIKGEENG